MNKKKFGKFINIVVLVLLGTFMLNACSLLNWPKQLEAPTLTLEGTVAKWNNVSGATVYSLYDGDVKIADVDAEKGDYTTHNFISNINKNVSKHYFTVIARADNAFDSERSNKVAYTYIATEEYDNKVDTASDSIDNSGVNAPTNLRVEGQQLVWDRIEGVSEYYVCFYTSCSENVTLKIDGNTVHLSDLFGSSDADIISVRVGAKIDNVIHYGSTLLYNRKDYGDYSEVFVFGNVLGDYYIEDMEELTQICYFAFINRVDELNVQFSTSFANSDKLNTIQEALNTVFGFGDKNGAFLETMSIWYQLTQAGDSGHEREYCITLGYSRSGETESANEPTITSTKYVKQSENVAPYYQNKLATWTQRDADYDDFASDRQERIIEVNTSEQLYWAVENGFTPTFPDGATEDTCTALRLYKKAKDVLRGIIYEGMTEYDKVRSIFDWICYNTVYDYAETGKDANPLKGWPGITGLNNNIKSTCYFLEGVLEQGLAVCDGYSKTFSLLCNMEGIDCYRVVGSASGGGHAWNKVKVDDEWYLCDITWAETLNYDAVNKVYVEYLSHNYFLVSDDTQHSEFQSEYTDAFRRGNSATGVYCHYETTYIDMDKLVQNLKLNDVIKYLFNGTNNTISEEVETEIRAFIYNNKTPNMENRRKYEDLLPRTIEKLNEDETAFSNYIVDLLGGTDYDSVKEQITVDHLIEFLNEEKKAGIKVDYSSYYDDDNRDLVLKDREDFEILTLYLLYSGGENLEILLYANTYVNSLFFSEGSALQDAFNGIKADNPIFDIEFTDIIGYNFQPTSGAYIEVDATGSEIGGYGRALIMVDKTTE